jgi:hypothetical protein
MESVDGQIAARRNEHGKHLTRYSIARLSYILMGIGVEVACQTASKSPLHLREEHSARFLGARV